MHISTLLRCSWLALSLAPIACTFPVKAGDNLDDPSGEDASADDPTGEPSPGVCGDGVVDEGEACDDGVDEPDDGCDATCTPTAALEWIYAPDEPLYLHDLAVGPAGHIVLVGVGVVITLDPDGSELWRKTDPEGDHAPTSVVVDEQGTIYVASELGTIAALDPDGDELWHSDVGDNNGGLALGHGALYSVDLLAGAERFTTRRHDRSTGAVAWATESPQGIVALAQDIAVAGPRIAVVGMGMTAPGEPTRPLLITYDDTGATRSFEFGDLPDRRWNAVAPTDDGGVVLAGFGPEADMVVERRGPDLTAQWTRQDEDSLGTQANGVASGPAGALAITGFDLEQRAGLIRRLDADGATVWTVVLDELDELDDGQRYPVTLEFGSDFLVVLGHDGGNHGSTQPWVRRFTAD